MNLIYASAGCVESGSDLSARDSFAWAASDAEARSKYEAMLDKCRRHVHASAKIVVDNPRMYTFMSPFIYTVAWVRISHPRIDRARRPFLVLPSLARENPSFVDELENYVVEVHCGGYRPEGPFEEPRAKAMQEALETLSHFFEF